MRTRVVRVFQDPFDVYIGRPTRGLWGSAWQNPFKIGHPHPTTGAPMARADVLEQFRLYINAPAQQHLRARLGELRGKVLGCWCATKGGITAADPLVCHGQILAEMADAGAPDG